ncbi:MAG: YlmC/YmxH family sporulation protein [Clostridia bacterium]|nr:YlmC/YmxH family sporulation protein [Clostridia bacterium]
MMTERIAELKDRQVVSVSDGTVLGMVGDIELDTESGRLTAIVIYGKQKAFGILGREDDLVIPWSEIEVIGSETILVRLTNFKIK